MKDWKLKEFCVIKFTRVWPGVVPTEAYARIIEKGALQVAVVGNARKGVFVL